MQAVLKRIKISELLTRRCKKPLNYIRCATSLYPSVQMTRKFHYHSTFTTHYYHEDIYDIQDEVNSDFMYKIQPFPVRDVLYPETDDPLIGQLNATNSLQEVFKFIDRYDKILDHKHLAQSVLVIWDLQRMYMHVNLISHVPKIDSLMKDYVSQLVHRDEFKQLLEMIEEKVEDFDAEAAACTLMYLQRIGVEDGCSVMQALIKRAQEVFKDDGDVSLKALSRFINALFCYGNTRAYFSCQDVLPVIFSHIGKCTTSEDLKLLSACLIPLNKIITLQTLESYKNKVTELLKNGIEQSTIIKIILFLNFPHWRNENTALICECIESIKDHFNSLNVYEILSLHEVIYRLQEPGYVLNDLQRCAYKFLHQLEEEQSPLLDIRLKLLNCIICFTSPAQRNSLESILKKYVSYDLNGLQLLQLYKIMFFIKTNDQSLCKKYWDKMLHVLEHDDDFRKHNLLKICYHYANFTNVFPTRHFKFEKRVNQWLEGEIEVGLLNMIPSGFTSIISFLIPFGMDISLLNHCVNKLDDMQEQLNFVDCINISKNLYIADKTKNPILKKRYVDKINSTIEMCTKRELNGNVSINETNLWLKGCIYRSSTDEATTTKLLLQYNKIKVMSSKLIKDVVFCMHSLNALLPQVIDLIVDYVCKHKNNMLGFNLENVAFMCYHLGHRPKRCDEFFEVLKNVLLRDEERLSGLSYLQSCIALCYFNTMTETFVKKVFNTSFLEKLDTELIHCYSKDIYPVRVRYRLMELNRLICIDYPECNVPWFHQKYVQELIKKEVGNQNSQSLLSDKIYDHLEYLFGDDTVVKRNVISHYGYIIDYVVESQKAFSENGSHNLASKLAVLTMKQKAFTKINVQLRGYYQQKIRHLEMFGYRVVVLNLAEWHKLVCGEDRFNYLLQNISPKRNLNIITSNDNTVKFNICEINS